MGLIWLLMQEHKLQGDIVLVDAHIRYRKPVSGRPSAVADMENLSGDLGRLAKGSKARIKLDVDICGDEGTGAVFSGTYIVLPSQNKQY